MKDLITIDTVVEATNSTLCYVPNVFTYEYIYLPVTCIIRVATILRLDV